MLMDIWTFMLYPYWAITNNAAVNIPGHIFWYPIFSTVPNQAVEFPEHNYAHLYAT